MGDIPPSIGDRLWPISRFVGYRPLEHHDESDIGSRGRMLPGASIHSGRRHQAVDTSDKQQSMLSRLRSRPWVQKALRILFTFLGSFFGAALLGTMARSQPFLRRNTPVLIGSFGAEATLLYAAHTSPLTQPRNVILGNTISAVIGVALAKGFAKLDGFQFGTTGNANWAAASLAISISIAVMQLFNITHPPGGATAVLAVTIPQIYNLSWFYVSAIAASSCIMLAWALVINNIGDRRYPAFWISPSLVIKRESH